MHHLAWKVLEVGPKSGPRLCFWLSQRHYLAGWTQKPVWTLPLQLIPGVCMNTSCSFHSLFCSCPFLAHRRNVIVIPTTPCRLTKWIRFPSSVSGQQNGVVSSNFHWIQRIHRWHLPIFLTLASDVWSLDPQVRKFLSSNLSPTWENRVSRSVAEEQTPLSQNTRGHSSFSPSPRHISDSDSCPWMPAHTIPSCSDPHSTHPHTFVHRSCSLHWSCCKPHQIHSEIHALICQSCLHFSPRISSRLEWRCTGEMPATYMD